MIRLLSIEGKSIGTDRLLTAFPGKMGFSRSDGRGALVEKNAKY